MELIELRVRLTTALHNAVKDLPWNRAQTQSYIVTAVEQCFPGSGEINVAALSGSAQELHRKVSSEFKRAIPSGYDHSLADLIRQAETAITQVICGITSNGNNGNLQANGGSGKVAKFISAIMARGGMARSRLSRITQAGVV